MRKHTTSSKDLSRRGFIKQGGMGAILTAGVAPYLTLKPRAFGGVPATPFTFTPFTIPVPFSPRSAIANITPANPNQPPGDANPVYHGIAPEYAPNHVSRAGLTRPPRRPQPSRTPFPMSLPRREFLRRSASAAAVFTILPAAARGAGGLHR